MGFKDKQKSQNFSQMFRNHHQHCDGLWSQISHKNILKSWWDWLAIQLHVSATTTTILSSVATVRIESSFNTLESSRMWLFFHCDVWYKAGKKQNPLPLRDSGFGWGTEPLFGRSRLNTHTRRHWSPHYYVVSQTVCLYTNLITSVCARLKKAFIGELELEINWT